MSSASVAFVTGGGMGVGRAIARRLASQGIEVAVNDIIEERAQAVADEIAQEGGSAITAVGDITDLETVRALMAATQDAFGPIGILINNAGVVPERRTGEIGLPTFDEMAPHYWRKIIDLNVYGVLNCVSVAAGMMKSRGGGRIVSIISDAGRVGEARMAVYSGAKAAVLGFTKAIAKELGPHKISANTIALATIAHEHPIASYQKLDADPSRDEVLAKVLKNYPLGRGLGRLARPEDVAGAVSFLVSEDASYITGQCLAVNGGFVMV